MKMRFILTWLILFSVSRHAAAQNAIVQAQGAANPPDFAKLSDEAASEAENNEESAILGSHEKIIAPAYFTNLATQIRLPGLSKEKRVLAICFLGRLRPNDNHSIEVLMEYIDLKTRFDPKTRISRWGEFPAKEALMRIGQPATPLVLTHLCDEKVKLRRRLMCEVLAGVEGKTLARQQIAERLAHESDSEKRANLEAALGEFDRL